MAREIKERNGALEGVVGGKREGERFCQVLRLAQPISVLESCQGWKGVDDNGRII